jgi:gluconate kinase
MGWFGVSLNEKDEAGWLAEVQRLLDETANDQLVSVFDCHI